MLLSGSGAVARRAVDSNQAARRSHREAKPRPSTKDVAWLAPKVEELSRAYNAGIAEGARTKLPLEARIAFSFPRDVPKGAAAVRELIASRALLLPTNRPLRVVDLGAGLGAMTWGLVRALEASGATGRVEALLVDEDEEVLASAQGIARAAHAVFGDRPIELAVTTRAERLASATTRHAGEPVDVAIIGQLLSEIDPRSPSAERIETHASLLAHVLRTMVAEDGALVVIEPALRERTRHLHSVRDRLLELGEGVTVFAPCLHAARCPALAIETEWCHEDLPVDLPPWVVPLARAAGLRWQGLTFSYLVLRKDGRLALPRRPPGDDFRFRAVSDLLRSKGKTEVFACAEDGSRPRVRRLERDAGSEQGIQFHDIRRGDIVTLRSTGVEKSQSVDRCGDDEAERSMSPVDARGRVKADVAIDVGGFCK